MNNFLIIDDHDIVRTGVKNLLQQSFQPCSVFEAWNNESVIMQLKEHVINLALLDVHIPGTNSMDLMQKMQQYYPKTRVLIFSMSEEKIYAKRFLKAGAMGFISKTALVPELKKAIEMVLNNRRYISENFADILASQMEMKETKNPFEKLSTREFDIATALIKGSSLNEVATSLNINVSTVGTYKARVFHKLQVKNIVELIEINRLYNEN